ncbi:MAG TPA: hypothetical protein VKB77_03865 [Terriglobales bacterium]|nr:hypothetical protein [Terriglobales bacterium]
MKKQLLVIALLWMSAGTTLVHGQANGVKVNVPFKFMAAGKTLSSGVYVLSSAHGRVLIENALGRGVAMALANDVSGHSSFGSGQVVFRCYRDECFLSQLWNPTEQVGHELLKSPAEIEVAKRQPGAYFALLGTGAHK